MVRCTLAILIISFSGCATVGAPSTATAPTWAKTHVYEDRPTQDEDGLCILGQDVSPQQEYVAEARRDFTIRVWGRGQSRPALTFEGCGPGVAFLDDDRLVTSGPMICIHSRETGEILASMKGSPYGPWQVLSDSDGEHFFTVDGEGFVARWSASAEQAIWVDRRLGLQKLRLLGPAEARKVAGIIQRREVFVADPQDRTTWEWIADALEAITDVDMLPDGRLIIAGASVELYSEPDGLLRGVVSVLDANTHMAATKVEFPRMISLVASHEERILAMDATGRLHVVGGDGQTEATLTGHDAHPNRILRKADITLTGDCEGRLIEWTFTSR